MPRVARAAGFSQTATVTSDVVATNQTASRMTNRRVIFPVRSDLSLLQPLRNDCQIICHHCSFHAHQQARADVRRASPTVIGNP